jgi:hypothetical protein
MSLRLNLPWSSCNNDWNTPDCAMRDKDMNCSYFFQLYRKLFVLLFKQKISHNFIKKASPKSPSEEYF